MPLDISLKLCVWVLWEDRSQPLIMVACIFRTELTVSLYMIFSPISSYFYAPHMPISILHQMVDFFLHETLFCRPTQGSFSDLCDVSIFYVFLHLSTFPASIFILLSSFWLIFLPQPFLGQTFYYFSLLSLSLHRGTQSQEIRDFILYYSLIM